MKNHKIIIITDSLLSAFIGFFACLLMLSALPLNSSLKISLCILFGLCISGIVFIAKVRKYKNYLLENKDKKALEKMVASLEIMPDNEVIALLFDILTKAKIECKIQNNYLKSENCYYLFDFSYCTPREKIANALKEHKNANLVFFCIKLSEEASLICSTFKSRLKIVTAEGLFCIMRKCNFSFEEQNQIKPPKFEKLKKACNKIFTKKRALVFALISATLLLFSSFVFYPLYYKVWSLVLIILSIVCLAFGKKEEPLAENLLTFD